MRHLHIDPSITDSSRIIFNENYALSISRTGEKYFFTNDCLYYYKCIDSTLSHGYLFERKQAARCGDAGKLEWKFTGNSKMIGDYFCKEILIHGQRLSKDSLRVYITEELPYFNLALLNLDLPGFIMESEADYYTGREIQRATFQFEVTKSECPKEFEQYQSEYTDNFIYSGILTDSVASARELPDRIVDIINSWYLPSLKWTPALELPSYKFTTRPNSGIRKLKKWLDDELEYHYIDSLNNNYYINIFRGRRDTCIVRYDNFYNPIFIDSKIKRYDIQNDSIWAFDEKNNLRQCYISAKDSSKQTIIRFSKDSKNRKDRYYSNGRLDSIRYTFQSVKVENYVYNDKGQLIKIYSKRKDNRIDEKQYYYHPNGLLRGFADNSKFRKITYSINIKPDESFDLKVVHHRFGNQISEYLKFDHKGNITMRDFFSGNSRVNRETIKYDYYVD